MSVSSDRKKKVKAYLIAGITSDGYRGYNQWPDVELKTDKEKIDFLYSVFVAEYKWAIDRMGQHKALKEWLQGLPSAIGFVFYNTDILEKCTEWGILAEYASEDKEEECLERYFPMLATELNELFRKSERGAL
jgi:hypothetical protein